jgi:repressor LexA
VITTSPPIEQEPDVADETRDSVAAAGAELHDFPDGPADETGLTPRQRRVLEVIRDAVERRGYPPSVREIGEAVGLTSSSSVHHQLAVLQRKGFLRRDPPSRSSARGRSSCSRWSASR